MKNIKIFAFLAIFLLSAAVSSAWAWKGSGTSDAPYQITSAADLTQLATDVNGGESYSNMYFKQTADITLSGEWTPIGTQSNPFKGHYDGGGFAIRGLRVTGNYKHAGLFGYISSDRYHGSQIFIELKNINIVDCVIDVGTVDGSAAGGIAGETGGPVRMTGNRVRGSITAYGNTGGLIGIIRSNATVSNNFVDVTVSGTGNQYNQYYHPDVCLMVSVSGGSSGGSGNYYHDNGGNVSVSLNTNITATPVYSVTVTAPVGLTDSDANVTLDGVKYYEAGEKYTLTLSTTNANEVIDEIAGVEATLEADKKSATFKMPSEDVTISATTAEVYTVSVPENLTISDAFATISGVNYYKAGETYPLTLSTTNANEIIDGITGVEATLEADLKTATFEMPSENVTITATTAEVYTVSFPENLTISAAFATIEGVDYYKAGEKYTLTLSTTNANEVIDGITGVEATLEADKKSATFTMPSEDVEISATISKIWGGDGSKELPYTIASVSELDMLALIVNSGNDFKDTYFEVIKDITYTYEGSEQENNYTAIGNAKHPFNGKFNGNGYTIKGIRIYKPNDDYQGLFGYLGKGAEVEKVKLADVEVTADNYAGGIAGYSRGSIHNCTVEKSVKLTSVLDGRNFGGIVGYSYGMVSGCTSSATLTASGKNSNAFGGIVGFNDYGTVLGCTSSATLTASGDNARNYGGIVGYNEGTVSGCTSSATLTASGDNARNYGGIVGYNVGTVSGCASSATLTASGSYSYAFGGIVGYNKGTVSGCTSSTTLTASGDNSYYFGGIVGENYGGTVSGCTSSATLTASGGIGGIVGYSYGGTVSGNFAKNVTVRAVSRYGAVIGYGYDSKLENNFYTACTVNGVENATNVGVGADPSPSDVTENNGAVGVFAVSLGEGLSITGPETPIYTDNDKNAYYKSGETVTLTLSTTNANEIIDGITGVEATLEADLKTATFEMPSENVIITATTAEVYTVSVPENLTISAAFATIEGVDYYKAGEKYTLTLSTTNANEVIDGITGVEATLEADKKSATFEMPGEDVEISATISKIWGNGDGSKDHPYTIASVSELDMLALIVNSGNDFKDTYFEVVGDIAYDAAKTDNGNNYTAIGDEEHPFNGKFNGNGHTISGIRINKIDADYQGLFGYLGESAEVENVKLADVEITGYHYIGGIAGYSRGSIHNCTVEKSVKLTSVLDGRNFGGIVGYSYGMVSGCTSSATLTASGKNSNAFGGIVGFNDYGTVSGCTSSATLTASGDDARNYGGIVGYNNGGSTVSGNFAKNVTVRAVSRYGAVIGYGYDSKLENNFYTACTVNRVKNATNVGVGADQSPSDVTENNGAVGVFAVSLGEGISITSPKSPIYTDNDKNAYYKAGETVTLTLSTTNANEVIDGITGVEATLEADRKIATFEMPGEDVTITATTAEVYTVSVPENLTISAAFATIESVDYYKSGETVTLTATKVNEFIDGITGVTATIAAARKSATFTMPSENVEMSASISKIWGGDDGRDGSKEHPYTIASVSELNELALVVNAGNDFKDTYFEVVEDIVYDVTQTDNGNNYTAIGAHKHPFKGKFNGNGHTISGIRIYKPNDIHQGLFGLLDEGAEVENVKLADVEITGGQFTGGIAGVGRSSSIRNCTVEKNVKLASTSGFVGGVVGDNSGTVTGCVSSATLTGSGVNNIYFGGIAGHNSGTVSDNLAINVSVSARELYGAVVGDNKFKLSNNFYIACTVAGVENATNVGTGHGDVTENNGAVSIHAVTLGEGVSVVTPENPIYTDSDQHNYYKAGETLTLEINFAGEKKTATFKIPNRDVEIVATASELHTVTVPEGLDISEPYITIGGIKYYRFGETYTLTLTTAKIDEVIGEITGVTASIANDRKTATFTMPSENVEISATISKILWGGDDGRDGSKEHPYTIASAAELHVLALTVNSGNDFKDTYFEVVEDIVYDVTQTDNGNNYTAIGDGEHPFNGKFNGNGHTISGIRINKIDVGNQGLFGFLGEGAEVENVKLADVEITGDKHTGGIAGDSEGSIRNCTVEKSVKLTSVWGGRFFGGIVGQNVGTVTGCISSATLTGSGYESRYFGGVAGYNSGTVTGCISSATLTGSGYGGQFGGIVGQDSKGFISNNIAINVSVSAREDYGAVVGYTNSKLENNFYTACTVNGVENATNVGVDGSDVTENYGAVGISFTEPAAVKDLVYNKLSHELVTAGKTSFGTLLYSLDGENYGTEIPAATNAKTYTVYYRVDKDGENVILPRTVKVSIAKIPLTVTAKDKSIVYGNEPANDGVEYDGFVGKENESVLGGKLSYSYSYKKLDKVGKYTITPSGLTSGNYDITYAAGTLTVEKADISVEALAAKEKLVYSGKSQELVTAGKTNFGTLLYSLDGEKYSAEIPTATDAKTYTVYYKVAESDNWNAFEAKKVEVKIAKAPLSVTAKDKFIVYGNEPANDGVEYDGFVGKENASVLGGKLTYSYNYKKLDKVGKYTITPSGLTSGNYEISFVAGALNVEPKATHYAAVQVLEDENGKRAEIDGEYGEGDGIVITEPLEVASVEFSRDFSTQGYSTIVLPFDVNTSKLSGVDSVLSFARIVKEQGEMAVGMKVVWEASASHVDLKANTPYMVKMTGAKLGIDGGVTLLPTEAAVTKSDAQNDGWEFRGTYAYKSWQEGDEDLCRVYGFAGGSNDEVSEGDFVKFTAGASLRPLRAYLINTNRTCSAPKKARAYGDYVLGAKYSIDDLPESMKVVIVGEDGHTTVIGHFNTRTGEFTTGTSVRKFDLKGRAVRGTPSARGAYYGKRVKK